MLEGYSTETDLNPSPNPNPDQVKQYTFREVRQKFGDQFKQRFWPVFQVSSK